MRMVSTSSGQGLFKVRKGFLDQTYCWFSHDVTKIQKTKLLILIFYFNDV